IQSGKARALAVTSRTRNPELPDVPTMIEAGLKDYEVVGWYALMAPPKLPDDVRNRLAEALSAVSQDPAFRKAMGDGGYPVHDGDGNAVQDRTEREYPMWADVLNSANIQTIGPRLLPMSALQFLRSCTRLPVIGAPMCLVSGPDLVIAQCAAGIVGTFPSL